MRKTTPAVEYLDPFTKNNYENSAVEKPDFFYQLRRQRPKKNIGRFAALETTHILAYIFFWQKKDVYDEAKKIERAKNAFFTRR